jgi:putative CocE/NonD family hydrolase
MQRSSPPLRWFFRAILAIGFAIALPAIAQETQPAAPTSQPEAGLPAPLSGLEDHGVFELYKNEERLATIRFGLDADGTLAGDSTISLAGQTVKQSVAIACDKNGRWTRIDMQTPLGPVEVVRDGTTATIKFRDDVTTLTLKPGTILFENMTPVLISQAVLHYDQAKGGKQTFPLFIVPQLIMDAWLERLDTVERTVGGRDYQFTRYLYGLPGVDLTAWVDDEARLYLADVPAQRAAYVREGFADLRKEPVRDPLLSRPEHDVKEQRSVNVPMRDGINLSADIYLPDVEEKVPAILIRTPYKKEMLELNGRFYARRGYAVVAQDCRGRFGSEGVWEPFVNEAEDGYDTIEWIATQPWCTGKVGMIGGSYVGWVQWWAASQNPPHLVTIIPNVSPPDPFFNIPYEYGVFFTLGSIWWADVLESEATADLSGATIYEVSDKDFHKILKPLPVIELDKAVLGKENPYWRMWIEHPVNGGYWDRANFLDKLEKVRIPVFHQSGWFDGDGIGSKLNYLRMVSYGHPYQKLILGPWGHTDEATRRVGDKDFGPEAAVDLPRQYLRWCDYWLKGIDNGIVAEPLVSLFVMGSNKWLTGEKYPLPQTRFEKWFLSSGGSANTTKGDGVLTPSKPAADAPPDKYAYDPGDPTPAPQMYREPEEEKGKVKSVEQEKAERKAYHAEVTAQRQDILVYTSEPLAEPLTIVGPLSAVLYAATTGRDTDWFMRLMEVDDEGEIFQLAEGKIRARFRESTYKPQLLEPGRIREYHLDLWQTGIEIPAGHRLRVEVASASFPLFSRNLNTGGHNEKDTDYITAQQTIYHNAQYPSHVLLPVIPADGG